MTESDKWDRLTINLDPDVAALARARARKLHQSASGYMSTLIERDLAAAQMLLKEDASTPLPPSTTLSGVEGGTPERAVYPERKKPRKRPRKRKRNDGPTGGATPDAPRDA